MAMDSETRKLLEEVWSTPLFESIFTRRSRRFGLGMEIPRGPNAYKSTAEPLPLSFEEEALLCMAATGMSGMNLADMPHTRKEELAPGEVWDGNCNTMLEYSGRTFLMYKRIVQENGIVADLFHDGSGKQHRAIVLLGGSEGGKAWSSRGTKKVVDQLVNMGYILLSLAYFKSPGLPPFLEEIPLEYFANAFKWLVNQPEVLPDELGMIGMSRGAEAALLLASRNPENQGCGRTKRVSCGVAGYS